MTPEKPTILRVHEKADRTIIEKAADADALPVMDWIRATAIREARKRVAQLKANAGKT